MSPVEKVSRALVGVDFDDASASALRMAGVMASTWDADITVFHASTPDAPAYFTGIRSRRSKPNASRVAPAPPPGSASSPRSGYGVLFMWSSTKVRLVTRWYEWRRTSI